MTKHRSNNTTMFLREAYKQINVSLVNDWISAPNDDKGILRRLDYAYGLTKDDDESINEADINEKGLLAILRKAAEKRNNNDVKELIEEIKQRCLSVKILLFLFLTADYDEFNYRCHNFLLKTLQIQNNPLDTTGIYKSKKHTISYRLRKMSQVEYNGYMDFFHIPFNKRYLIGTYRYSIPGYPSLYTSSSVYCAWEELGKPINEEIGIFAFKAFKGMRLLDLRFRFDIPRKNATNDIANYLLTLPLILACSMQVKDGSEHFAPEYIIPQQVFKCLMSQLRIALDTKESWDPLMGIAYTSTKKDILENIINNPLFISKATNYALLAHLPKNQEKAKYSDDLAGCLWGKNVIWRTFKESNDVENVKQLDDAQNLLSENKKWHHMKKQK